MEELITRIKEFNDLKTRLEQLIMRSKGGGWDQMQEEEQNHITSQIMKLSDRLDEHEEIIKTLRQINLRIDREQDIETLMPSVNDMTIGQEVKDIEKSMLDKLYLHLGQEFPTQKQEATQQFVNRLLPSVLDGTFQVGKIDAPLLEELYEHLKDDNAIDTQTSNDMLNNDFLKLTCTSYDWCNCFYRPDEQYSTSKKLSQTFYRGRKLSNRTQEAPHNKADTFG
jgi:hypothetical protein